MVATAGVATHPVLGGSLREGGAYEEVFAGDGSLRMPWQRFTTAMFDDSSESLVERWARAQTILRQNGVTYNVYADSIGQERPWALDPLPLIITASEWRGVEAGVRQRARLMDAILQDIYGPQQLLHRGDLPPEVVFDNPGFLRPCCGVNLMGRQMLTLCAVDLGRDRDGNWLVLDQRTQAPSGSGYALENRTVMSTVFERAFTACNVERLARYFRNMREELVSLAPLNRANPRVVLLSPGPFNESYFEHYYLAKYLGLTLVEGADLTVRNERVFMKTLDGLLPVDVIVRRQDDWFCDALELRGDSLLSIPGLMQAVRAGHVAVANALGSAIGESLALMPFMPLLCRKLLGEELLLPSVETWWLGEKNVFEMVLAKLEDYVIKQAYVYTGARTQVPASMSSNDRRLLIERIKQAPGRFVAQKKPPLAVMPVWEGGETSPRLVSLRTFLSARGGEYACMPGGLTRATTELNSTQLSMQHGAGSKDTWIIHDEPPPYESLLPAQGSIPEICRSGIIMPSRTADNLYWLGRYVERAESMARILRCIQARSASAETRAGDDLQVLERILRTQLLPEGKKYDKLGLIRAAATAAYGDQVGSVVGHLKRARALAALLRDSLSSDSWNIALTFVTAPPRGNPEQVLLDFLDLTIRRISAFAGITFENMTRGPGWRFMDLGRRVERSLQTAELILACQPELHEEEPELLEALLSIMDSSITYRSRYLNALRLEPVADLLLLDDSNPRSLAFQLRELNQHVRLLDPANKSGMPPEQRLAFEALSTATLADLGTLCRPEGKEAFDETWRGVQGSLEALHDVLARRFFSHSHPVQLRGS